jgi:hypothetical protein
MTILILVDQGLEVASQEWTAADAGHGKTFIFSVLMVRCRLSIDIPFEEFIGLIAEGGKIVDLRKLQEPR